jgi:pyruvate kinase
MRKTKIIATLGPASNTDVAIRELIDAGVDVFRFNFSHGTHEGHAETIARVRRAAEHKRRVVALLQDLSGPKIRTGRLRGRAPITLTSGDPLTIAVGEFEGEPGRVSTTFDLPRVVRPGDCLLLDDGRLQLRVEEVSPGELRTRVVDGGPLGEHKGINVPGVEFPTTGLTTKDINDLKFGVAQGVDLIALSFVQSAEVLRQARTLLREAGAPEIPVIAKLERPEAIARLDEIIQEADAVMVARGDLGLELPLERVPRIQKEITRKARSLEVPVIVATQVLESMRTEPRPTRAEVSDAANAVHDGVDAIMLAGETAAGAFPVKAVQTLDTIIREAEAFPPVRHDLTRARFVPPHVHAVCESAVTLAERGDAAAIVAVTRGGKTARVLSALRPQAPIYAATDDAAVLRGLSLVWGVAPALTDPSDEVNAAAARIGDALVAAGAVAAGAVIVVVSVTHDLSSGPSNFVKLQRV